MGNIQGVDRINVRHTEKNIQVYVLVSTINLANQVKKWKH